MGENQPKYLRLLDQLSERIRAGEWMPGDRLPSEMQLAEEYGVAYLTVRSAVEKLVKSGGLRRIRGRGTFVCQPLPQGHRPTIGLLVPPGWNSMDPFYFPSIVAGFVSRAQEEGFHVYLADRSEPLLELSSLKAQQIEGVGCILMDQSDLQDADALLDHGLAVVAINRYEGGRRIPAVVADNRAGSYAAAMHLAQLGHRDFVFVAGPRWNLDASERRKGVQRALKDAGLPKSALTILEGTFDEHSGYERGVAIARMRRLPTAIMVASDLAATGLLKALHDHSIAVPDSVSLVGFGDFRLTSFTWPALTTVRLPLNDLGRQAASMVLNQLRGVHEPSIKLPCSLVLRDSTSAPRNNP